MHSSCSFRLMGSINSTIITCADNIDLILENQPKFVDLVKQCILYQ